MADDRLQNLRDTNAETRKQIDNLNNIKTIDKERAIINQQINDTQRLINELNKESVETGKNNSAVLGELNAEQVKLTAELEKSNKKLERQNLLRKTGVDIAKQLAAQLKVGWKYLQDADKIIKSTNINLGMAGSKAVAMRDAFEKSAGYVARLGGSIADIQSVMQGYADETGRARVMSAEMVKDITAIGKGTGLGIEQATRLGAQFELMGFDAKSTMDYVQGVVDTSERMGVNTTKVLKVVNDNFKKLNTYTFQQGVKGFAEMAMYAEKFKIDIGDALNAADVARSLEGAIDLAAQLQVMGGEFAKTDPFEMLFLARNDPAKFTEKIADMTKGLVTFRKMADGSFEKFISPADRDRIAAVAKSMGMEASALTEITLRQAEIQKMRQQMGGLGLTAEQKEIIEGAAIYNKETGKFQVSLAGTMINIRELTTTQAKSFKAEQKLLEERAKEALTFDESFKATINILKASLLPLLKTINTVLEHTIKPIADMAASGGWGLVKAGGILLAAGGIWKGITWSLNNWASKATRMFSKGRGVAGAGADMVYSKTGALNVGASKARFVGKSNLAKAMGTKALKTGAGAGLAGAGFGAAMAGAGAGVMLAAKGISQLADAMSKLTPKQAESLNSVVKSLAWFMGGAAIAAVGIMALGTAAGATTVPLLAFGAAILMVGAGIGIAAAGIGLMGVGLSELVKNSKGAGEDMMKVGAGIGVIAAAMGLATLGLPGALGMSLAIRSIAKHGDGLVKVGNAFKNINAVMSGNKDDFIAVEKAVSSISNMNTKGGGMLADLANLLKKPLKVEFANNGKVSLTNDITLNLDGKVLMSKSYNVNIALQKHENLRNGKGDLA